MSEFAIKGRSGYVLRPSAHNPRVKRWQKAEAAGATKPRGRASVAVEAIDRDLLEGYGWVELADNEEFKNRFGPSLGEYLDDLIKASKRQRLGWHEGDYTSLFYPSSKRLGFPDDQSLMFGQIEGLDGRILKMLKVRHPDQYAVAVLGTALPFFALHSDPARSRMAFDIEGDGLLTTITFANANGEKLLTHQRLFKDDGDLRDYIYDDNGFPPEFHELRNVLLEVHPALQGFGLANPMYAAQTRLAGKMGIDNATLTANLGVGAYAWPLLGYDFDDEGDVDWAADELRSYLYRLHKEHGQISDDEYLDLEEKVGELYHAWDFARFTIPEGVGKDASPIEEWRKAGKHALLGKQFEARRDFDDTTAYNVMTETIDRRLKKAGLGGRPL